MAYGPCSSESEPSSVATAKDSVSFQQPRDAYQRFAVKYVVKRSIVTEIHIQRSVLSRINTQVQA